MIALYARNSPDEILTRVGRKYAKLETACPKARTLAAFECAAALVPPETPLPDLMMASYHEAIGWNACREAMIAAAQGKK